jgi:nucleoside-diphosphate-sugar epimerase
MNRLLITGATGFLGVPCVLHAAREFEVHALARVNREVLTSGVRFHSCDLFDADQVDRLLATIRPTHLLHLAWIATPGVYWTSSENHRWVAASKHLLGSFAKCGGLRAVITGSCAEYDWTGSGVCHEFKTPLRPATVYGQCKNELRQWIVASFGHTGLPPCATKAGPSGAGMPQGTQEKPKEGNLVGRCLRSCTPVGVPAPEGPAYLAQGGSPVDQRLSGLSVAWARLFFLYGEREHPARLVSSVARSLLAGEAAECSAGTQERDFLHTNDVADALIALVKSDLEGPINIGSGDAVSVRSVIEVVARVCGRPELVRFGARPTPPGEPQLLVADVSRLRNELNWRPSISLEDGVREVVNWWRIRRAA